MTGIVHCILTPEGPRFRLWSTSSKRYLTTPLSEAELIQAWYSTQVTPFISRMTMVEALVEMSALDQDFRDLAAWSREG